MKRSDFLRAMASAPFVMGVPLAARANAYPSRAITVVVPYPPGGVTDAASRLMADSMARALAQPFVVANKPGAATMIGTEFVKAAPKDGYTLLLGSSTTFSLNPLQYPELRYSLDDFECVGGIAKAPYGMSVAPQVPAKTLPEFVAWAKQQAKGVTYGTVGQGSTTHIAAAMLTKALGITAMPVHYKGSAQVQADLLAGVIDMAVDPLLTQVPMHKAGKAQLLGLLGKDRWPEVPDVKTLEEQGVKGIDAPVYVGFFAPKGTPADAMTVAAKALSSAAASPANADRFRKLGMVPAPLSGAAFTQLLRDQQSWWKQRIAENGIKIDA